MMYQLVFLVLLLFTVQPGRGHYIEDLLEAQYANIRNLSSIMGSILNDLKLIKTDLQELKEQHNTLDSSISSLSDTVSDLNYTAVNHSITVTSLSETTANLSKTVSILSECQQEHKDSTVAKLEAVENSFQSSMHSLHVATARLSSQHRQIQANISDVECVDAEESLQFHQNLQENLTHQLDSFKSLLQVQEPCDISPTTTTTTTITATSTTTVPGPTSTITTTLPPSISIITTTTCAVTVPVIIPTPTCTPRPDTYSCGGTDGWRRAVYLNMTEPNTTCPSGWRETDYSKRTCGQVSDKYSSTCDSVTFNVSGVEYSRVCGRIRAYQHGTPDGLYYSTTTDTIDSYYADGLILSHGEPREHIWTFVNGWSENPDSYNSIHACPCDATSNRNLPSFVGEDYFCESGFQGARPSVNTLYSDDVLWDGEDCHTNSTCCSMNNPPYFIKQLTNSTTDDIEARLCLNEPQSNEDIAVELVEIYIQ